MQTQFALCKSIFKNLGVELKYALTISQWIDEDLEEFRGFVAWGDQAYIESCSQHRFCKSRQTMMINTRARQMTMHMRVRTDRSKSNICMMDFTKACNPKSAGWKDNSATAQAGLTMSAQSAKDHDKIQDVDVQALTLKDSVRHKQAIGKVNKVYSNNLRGSPDTVIGRFRSYTKHIAQTQRTCSDQPDQDPQTNLEDGAMAQNRWRRSNINQFAFSDQCIDLAQNTGDKSQVEDKGNLQAGQIVLKNRWDATDTTRVWGSANFERLHPSLDRRCQAKC